MYEALKSYWGLVVLCVYLRSVLSQKLIFKDFHFIFFKKFQIMQTIPTFQTDQNYLIFNSVLRWSLYTFLAFLAPASRPIKLVRDLFRLSDLALSLNCISLRKLAVWITLTLIKAMYLIVVLQRAVCNDCGHACVFLVFVRDNYAELSLSLFFYMCSCFSLGNFWLLRIFM